MTGGLYLWKDGREVPDTMNVSMDHAKKSCSSPGTSGFGNDELSVTEDVLGDRRHHFSHTPQSIRYTPEKVNRRDGNGDGRHHAQSARQGAHGQFPRFHPRRRQPNCPFDLGYRVAIACRMAVESYRQQRTVRWDAAKEEIV